MHPINNHNFGVNGIAVTYYNGTSSALGYIVKQTGTNKFNVTSNGTTIYSCIFATTLGAAEALGVDSVSGLNQMTILVAGKSGTEHVYHIYDNQVKTLEGNSYPWKLVNSYDGSVVLEAFSDASTTFSAGTHGGPTVMSFVTAPASATHGTASHAVVVATNPIASSELVMDLFLTTSATALPTTGAISPSSYSDGTYGFNVAYASAGTFYVFALLSDASYLVSNALVIS